MSIVSLKKSEKQISININALLSYWLKLTLRTQSHLTTQLLPLFCLFYPRCSMKRKISTKKESSTIVLFGLF